MLNIRCDLHKRFQRVAGSHAQRFGTRVPVYGRTVADAPKPLWRRRAFGLGASIAPPSLVTCHCF
jgi:hypothetical protein